MNSDGIIDGNEEIYKHLKTMRYYDYKNIKL